MTFFHVEISSGMRHARVFNLSREDLDAKVIEPWLAERPIEMGDREWEPPKSSLKILEGRHMETTDLSFGQGWANAERESRSVAKELLLEAPPPRQPDAFVVEAEAAETVTADLVGGHGGRAIPWAEARAMLDGRDPRITAVVLVLRPGEREPR